MVVASSTNVVGSWVSWLYFIIYYNYL